MDQFHLVYGGDLRPLSSLVIELAPQLPSRVVCLLSSAVTEEMISCELMKKNRHHQQPNPVAFQQLVSPSSIPSVHIRPSVTPYSARSSVAFHPVDVSEEQAPERVPGITPGENRDSLYYSTQSVQSTATNVSLNDGAKEERHSKDLEPITEAETAAAPGVESIEEEEAEEPSDEQDEHRKSCTVL